MTRAERTVNLIGVVLPFLGVLVADALLWNRAVDGIDLAILGAMYLLTGIGVTVGFHRLLTHRSFQTYPWLERTFCDPGVPVRAGLGDGLGGRPSQAPCSRGQGG
jgi:stearoyl-CoA desaturase (Delta-9 desaturase)